MEGRCTCGGVRYRLEREPIFVHCCHCTWCQRETGAAFATNALIEATAVTLLAGETEETLIPSESGGGQRIHRCPACRIAVWGIYPGAGPGVLFIRVGTLDDPAACPPGIHVFTGSKVPWVVLPDGVPAVPEFYEYADLWPAESLRRYAAATGSPSA